MMFHSLINDVPGRHLTRHRSLIEALFGVKEDNPSEDCDSTDDIEWTWENAIDNDFVVLTNNKRDVKFHRNISSGTAVVRGSQPMSTDQHFWELKMTSPVYGTDMMVGIGTSDADMNQVHDKFLSLLGNDDKTWGLSYTGLFRHNGVAQDFSTRFGQGSIVGVHLDMWNGTLSYYVDKKHLGIACKGLKGKTVHAMASSTAACSGMRIIRSCSFPSSLQFLCCTKLRELIPGDKNVLKEIHLPPGLHSFLESNLGWLFESRSTETVQPCLVSPRRTQQGFGFDNVSDIMLPFQVEEVQIPSPFIGRSSGNQNVVIMNDEPVLYCTLDQVYGGSSTQIQEVSTFNPVIRFGGSDNEEPIIAQELSVANIDDFIQEEFGSLMPPPSLPQHIDFGSAICIIEESSGSENEVNIVEVIEEDADLIENGAKRRRCSYNYVMGFSDSDSD